MKKTFVLDTNVLLHSAQSLESFQENNIVLPMAVIEELDKFKKNQDELGRNARQVIRKLDSLRVKGHLYEGVLLNGDPEHSGTLRILTAQGQVKTEDLNRISDSILDMSIADNRILQVAYMLHQQQENVFFISKDINLRLKADALGINVMDFENQKIDFERLYSGNRTIQVATAQIDELYNNRRLEIELEPEICPNEFVLFQDENNPKHSAIARYKGGYLNLVSAKLERSIWNIQPRNKAQRMALDLLMDPDVKLITLVGQAGTGKTLLALAAALELVLHEREYEKILVSRPIVPMGNDIGFLPGDKDQKLAHWMQPIFDNLDYLMHSGKQEQVSSKKTDDLIGNHIIELEALTYIRGRSIPRQLVIIDEAQNLTPHEVKTIVSRAGEGTKMVLTGDPYQIDNPYLDSASNGLSYAVESLRKHKISGHITLTKSERSELAGVAAEYL
ncbi:MAG: PhoH family protein [Victivallaceae bacterium]|nr:PhoH family protein [Victivallaceae bacterium]